MIDDLCLNCKQPRTAEKSGSLTQWLFVCNCSSLSTIDNDDSLSSFRFQVCRKCSKRIAAGRSGSLTQFVFRADTCQCPTPEALDVAVARVETKAAVKQSAASEEDGADTLDLSVESFPIDRYKPVRELGKGASGTVYLCVDRILGIRVAVKVLLHSTTEQLLSFQQEVRAICRLTHPNIVRILDFGATDSGTPYMVLEYIDGTALDKVLTTRQKLSPLEAVNISLALCDALSYSHSKEIYHRDLKPSNILVVDDATIEAKLVDFGIARSKFETQEPTLYQGTTIVGTPGYMAPDQMRGISYDQRSEIYSLGCVMFEMLAGKQPYSAATALELLSLHANAPVPPLGGDLDPRLNGVIARCMAKVPAERYPHIDDLRGDLEEFKASYATPGITADGNWESATAARAPRKFKVWPMVAAFAILAVTGTAVAFFANQTEPQQSPKIREQFTIIGKGFDLNKFRGQYWLFNVSPLSDSSVDEILQSKIKKRLFLDGGSLSPQAILRLKPIGVKCLAAVNLDFTDEHMKAVSQLRTISYFRLYETPRLSDKGLSYLKNMDHLQDVFLRSKDITDQGVANLAEVKSLRTLSLDRCTGISDACIESIAKMKSLQGLSVAATPITTKGIFRIAQLKNLRSLSLCKLKCDLSSIKALLTMNLECLSLRETPVINDDIQRLSQIPTLEFLDIRQAKGTRDFDELKFSAARQAKNLPPCMILRSDRSGARNFGDTFYATNDDEAMWVD